jgi:hypothetical protein
MNPFASIIDNHYHFGFMILIGLSFLRDESVVAGHTFAKGADRGRGSEVS